MQGPNAIALERVGKRFDARHAQGSAYEALAGFDLTIGDGEFFCLLGPTGCGKSTVMHLVAGFELPTSGRVRVCGARPNRRDAPVWVTHRWPPSATMTVPSENSTS